MIAQLVIAFYFIVCVGIILFNCFTEIISRYRSCVLKRREQRYCEEYRQLFLENITENKKQEKRLVKELHSTSRLLTFSEALYKVENSMPEQFQQGIASVSYTHLASARSEKRAFREQILYGKTNWL